MRRNKRRSQVSLEGGAGVGSRTTTSRRAKRETAIGPASLCAARFSTTAYSNQIMSVDGLSLVIERNESCKGKFSQNTIIIVSWTARTPRASDTSGLAMVALAKGLDTIGFRALSSKALPVSLSIP